MATVAPSPLPPSSPPPRYRAPHSRLPPAAAPPLPRPPAPLLPPRTASSVPFSEWREGSRSRSVPPSTRREAAAAATAAASSNPFQPLRAAAEAAGDAEVDSEAEPGKALRGQRLLARRAGGARTDGAEGEVESRDAEAGISRAPRPPPFQLSPHSSHSSPRQPSSPSPPFLPSQQPQQQPLALPPSTSSALPPSASPPRSSSSSSSASSSSLASSSRRGRLPSSPGTAGSADADSGSGDSDGSPELSSLHSARLSPTPATLPSPPAPHRLAAAQLRNVFPSMGEAGEALPPSHPTNFFPPSYSAFGSGAAVASDSAWPQPPCSLAHEQTQPRQQRGDGLGVRPPSGSALAASVGAPSVTGVDGSLLFASSAVAATAAAECGELSSSGPFPPLLSSHAASAGSTRSSTPTSTSSQSGSSSAQLLSDDPDVFTAHSWHSSSAACLLRATEAVDVCCHAIVATNGRFHHSSSVTLESRRLALTVAVFERSLYAYALRISNARQQQRQRSRRKQSSAAAGQQSNHHGTPSNASSTNTTPTLAPSPAHMPGPQHLASLLPYAPFVPQQGEYMDAHQAPPDWSQTPLSYASTIPSSTAHSLASSAMATSSRLQQHAQQQHQRFLQHTHQQPHASSPKQQRTSQPATSAPTSASPSSASASAFFPPSLPPLSSVALPLLSISPVVTSSYASPASPIPPTVAMPPSQWGTFRASSSQFHSSAHPPAPLDPASIPSIVAAATPSQRYRSRTFSASALHSSHSSSPAPPPPQQLLAPAIPTSSPSLHPRSQSPFELGLSSPHVQAAVAAGSSPVQPSRSLLHLQPPLAVAAPHSSSTYSSQPPTNSSTASPSSTTSGWHQPAGMSCLLRILTQQLLETRALLLSLNDDCSSFPRYLRHVLQLTVSAPPKLVRSVARHPSRVMAAASLVSLLSLLHSAPPLQRVRAVASRSGGELWRRSAEHVRQVSGSSAAAFLLSFIPPSIRSTILTVAAVLSPHVLLPQLRSAVHTRAAFTIIPLCLWLLYRFDRYRRITHLRALHSRLGLLLRLWHICFSLLDQPHVTGAAAGEGGDGGAGAVDDEGGVRGTDVDDSFVLGARESARVPISRWLLELVPPELDASFWYHSSSFRLSLVKYGLDVLYSCVQEWWRVFGCRSVGVPYLLAAALYFAAQPHLAAATASRLMAAPNLDVVRHAWQLLDTTLARRLVMKALPAIAQQPKLAVCREIELLDVDESDHHRRHHQRRAAGRRRAANAQSPAGEGPGGMGGGGGAGGGSDEEDEGRFEVELSPSSASERVLRFDASQGGVRPPHRHLRRYQRAAASARLRESLSSSLDDEAELAGSADPSLRLLLLSARPLRLTVNLRFHRVPSHSHVRSLRPSSSAVVLYFHGGGFFTDFRASHLHFLSQWAVDLDVPILYVNYSLAPENAYPTALNECYDVYRWVVEGRLGINAERVVLVGDSTGANLAAATCMKAIIDGCRIPDAVVLSCPILNLRLTPTPSRSLYMMDAVLPMNLLLLCRSLYLQGSGFANDADIDPCLSPIVASDLLLKQWPTTSIMVGGYDPFVDDAVDFAHRLARNHVPVRLKVYDQLPHSFWDFAPLLPQAQHAVHLAAAWIQSAFNEQHTGRDTDTA